MNATKQEETTTTVLQFIHSNPNCTVNQIGEHLDMPNVLPLYNTIRSLLKQAKINMVGTGKNAQYTLIDELPANLVQVESNSDDKNNTLIETVSETTENIVTQEAIVDNPIGEIITEATTDELENMVILEQGNETIIPNSKKEEEGNNTTIQTGGYTRDQSSYSFMGKEFKKGPLALAVVKKTVEKNPAFTLANLKETFPDEIVKYYGICQTLKYGQEKSGKYYQRYFIKADQIIKLQNGEEIVVTNQWTKDSIEKFIVICKKLGFKIK